MLLPSISTKIGFDGVISTASLMLSEAGVLIVTAGHPWMPQLYRVEY